MKLKIIIIFILFFLFQFSILNSQFSTPKAYAQTPTCTPLFGGGTSCAAHPNLVINKQIQDPSTGAFLEQLTTVSALLPENRILTFRLTVTNSSEKTLENITLSDTLPAVLNFKSGNGKFDTKTAIFSDTIERLDKGQTKSYTIMAEADLDAISRTTACFVNQAQIMQAEKKGSDYVKICINISKTGVKSDTTQRTKGGLPIYNQSQQSRTPDTGAELLDIISLPFLASIGYILRRKVS